MSAGQLTWNTNSLLDFIGNLHSSVVKYSEEIKKNRGKMVYFGDIATNMVTSLERILGSKSSFQNELSSVISRMPEYFFAVLPTIFKLLERIYSKDPYAKNIVGKEEIRHYFFGKFVSVLHQMFKRNYKNAGVEEYIEGKRLLESAIILTALGLAYDPEKEKLDKKSLEFVVKFIKENYFVGGIRGFEGRAENILSLFWGLSIKDTKKRIKSLWKRGLSPESYSLFINEVFPYLVTLETINKVADIINTSVADNLERSDLKCVVEGCADRPPIVRDLADLIRYMNGVGFVLRTPESQATFARVLRDFLDFISKSFDLDINLSYLRESMKVILKYLVQQKSPNRVQEVINEFEKAYDDFTKGNFDSFSSFVKNYKDIAPILQVFDEVLGSLKKKEINIHRIRALEYIVMKEFVRYMSTSLRGMLSYIFTKILDMKDSVENMIVNLTPFVAQLMRGDISYNKDRAYFEMAWKIFSDNFEMPVVILIDKDRIKLVDYNKLSSMEAILLNSALSRISRGLSPMIKSNGESLKFIKGTLVSRIEGDMKYIVDILIPSKNQKIVNSIYSTLESLLHLFRNILDDTFLKNLKTMREGQLNHSVLKSLVPKYLHIFYEYYGKTDRNINIQIVLSRLTNIVNDFLMKKVNVEYNVRGDRLNLDELGGILTKVSERTKSILDILKKEGSGGVGLVL